ncbi:MAG: PilZ domain-containing protein [Planctomycetes bacterium]|nr:PilZ domain-containing protein [Planctomycetota bacterium]
MGVLSNLNLSKESVQIEVTCPSLPVLPICSHLDTVIKGRVIDAAIRLRAKVISQHRVAGGIACAFEYEQKDWKSIDKALSRREHHRVRPSQSLPLVAHTAKTDRLEVADISAGGIALLVSETNQRHLMDWTVELTLVFPNHEGDVTIQGDVRVRKYVGPKILYGIEFDGGRTSEYPQKQAIIRQYVMQRQTEELAGRVKS